MKTSISFPKNYSASGSNMAFSERKAFYLILILTLFVCLSPSLGQYTDVADMYYYSITNPGTTDAFIAQNRSAFNNNFFSCLETKREQAGIEGVNCTSFCDGLPYDQAQKCRQDCWAVGIYMWTNAIEDAIRNGTPWTETIMGYAALVAQQQCVTLEVMMPGFTEMTNQINYDISRSLVCY
jgi:hypothetical protein